MPWQEVVTVELRQQFVHDALRRVVPVTELWATYGISRSIATTRGAERGRRPASPAFVGCISGLGLSGATASGGGGAARA